MRSITRRIPRLYRLSLSLIAMWALASSVRGEEPAVSYNRDIRPILSESCFKCHGPDSGRRKGNLRLDRPESALAPAKSGAIAFVPGNLDKSEVIRRITAINDDIMPPASEHKALTPHEIEVLRAWVKAGAKYEGHWAFAKIQSPAVPPRGAPGLPVRNPIDAFIGQRLVKEDLKPSAPEEKARLIRRVTLDLTGLPPTIADVDRFLADDSPDAYEKVVNRLLASPHFGERIAVPWLDLARQSDTGGYHNDSLRTTWMYRDWVVKAFNDNKPFDQFTLEQIAGDLLPNSTVDNKIASGFMRNVMTSDEGGIIAEEYLNLYIVDRVGTLGTTWLGMTVSCAQCHDHKYDPVTQRDFYSLYAFFHNVPEKGIDGVRDQSPEPRMIVAPPELQTKLDRLAAEVKSRETELQEIAKTFDTREPEWEKKILAQAQSEPAGPWVKLPLENNGIGSTDTGQTIDAQSHDGGIFTNHDGRLGFDSQGKGWLDYGDQFDFERDQPFSVAAMVSVSAAGGSPFGKMNDSNGVRWMGCRIPRHQNERSSHQHLAHQRDSCAGGKGFARRQIHAHCLLL